MGSFMYRMIDEKKNPAPIIASIGTLVRMLLARTKKLGLVEGSEVSIRLQGRGNPGRAPLDSGPEPEGQEGETGKHSGFWVASKMPATRQLRVMQAER